jgi:molybdopterin/thiamine biosynthesis adenylyltransferase
MSAAEPRYRRQVALPQLGAAGQARLGRGRALVVGLGGLGCPAALYLATSGVRHLVLNDFDTVDESNLARQVLYAPHDVGRRKADAAAERLARLDPGIVPTVLAERLDDAALRAAVAAADVVLDCSDNFPTRFALNRACAAAGRALVSGAAIRFEGQVAVFRLDRGAGPCYECLYSPADENLADCAGQGILAPVAGTVGTMMAMEAVRVLAHLGDGLAGRLWAWDALAGTSRTIGVPRRADCVVCGGPRGA